MPREHPEVSRLGKRPRLEGRGELAGGGRDGARTEGAIVGEEGRRDKTHPAGRPRWMPPGMDFGSLAKEVRAALAQIVDPLYEQLVLGAFDALEKSTGLTIVHLVWQEILDQQRLGRASLDDPLVESLNNREEILRRHLELVDAKVKATYVLARLRELRRLWDARTELRRQKALWERELRARGLYTRGYAIRGVRRFARAMGAAARVL